MTILPVEPNLITNVARLQHPVPHNTHAWEKTQGWQHKNKHQELGIKYSLWQAHAYHTICTKLFHPLLQVRTETWTTHLSSTAWRNPRLTKTVLFRQRDYAFHCTQEIMLLLFKQESTFKQESERTHVAIYETVAIVSIPCGPIRIHRLVKCVLLMKKIYYCHRAGFFTHRLIFVIYIITEMVVVFFCWAHQLSMFHLSLLLISASVTHGCHISIYLILASLASLCYIIIYS